MKTRVIVGALLGIMLILILYFDGLVLISVLALFSLAAVYELGLTFRNKGYQPFLLPAYIFAGGFGYIYYYLGLLSMVEFYLTMIMITMVSAVFSTKRRVPDVIAEIFIYIYPLLLLICILLVNRSFEHPLAMTASCLALAGPEFCDMLAYFGGTLLGKHKLCPSISPKKTVEGSVFGLLGGVLCGALLIFLQPLWGGPVKTATLLLVGLGCGIFAQLGDLFASTIKRWSGIKDFSSIFPGHGGIMDRIDSILFCAPFVLLVFTILTKLGIY